jgi:hypothetical protein
MRDNSGLYSPPSEPWDGSAPSTAWKSHSTDYLNRSNISTSTSSPSILSQSSDSTITRDRNALNGSTSSQASPPPTSSSFTSFRTFGAQQQQEQAPKIKSYGFSGRSQMRDETYLRNVGKQQQRSGKGTLYLYLPWPLTQTIRAHMLGRPLGNRTTQPPPHLPR